MKIRICLLSLILLCSQSAFSQTRKQTDSFHSVSLDRLVNKVNFASVGKLKIKDIVLADFKILPSKSVYVFHLKDSKTGFELGKELTKSKTDYFIYTDETIGKSLIDQKDEWLNQKVNVYLEPRNVGLMPLINVGFVMKIELLDKKGKVVKIIQQPNL